MTTREPIDEKIARRTFLEKSSLYAHVNALGREWEKYFANAIEGLRDDATKRAFKIGFARAIDGKVSPREYEIATSWDFDTPEEYRAHLQRIWEIFYPGADYREFADDRLVVLAPEQG